MDVPQQLFTGDRLGWDVSVMCWSLGGMALSSRTLHPERELDTFPRVLV